MRAAAIGAPARLRKITGSAGWSLLYLSISPQNHSMLCLCDPRFCARKKSMDRHVACRHMQEEGRNRFWGLIGPVQALD